MSDTQAAQMIEQAIANALRACAERTSATNTLVVANPVRRPIKLR